MGHDAAKKQKEEVCLFLLLAWNYPQIYSEKWEIKKHG